MPDTEIQKDRCLFKGENPFGRYLFSLFGNAEHQTFALYQTKIDEIINN